MNTPICFSNSLFNSQFDTRLSISASKNYGSSSRRSSFIKRNSPYRQTTKGGRLILPTEEPLRRIGDDEFLVVKRRETLRRKSTSNRPVVSHTWHSLTSESTPHPSQLRRSTMDMNLLSTGTSGIGQQDQEKKNISEEEQHFRRTSLVLVEKLYSLNFDDDALKSLITDVEKTLESK